MNIEITSNANEVIFPRLKIYKEFIKKTPAEIANKICFDISLKAYQLTPSTPPDKIKSDRNAQSRKDPRASLQNIMVNKKRGKGNGLYGARMASATNRAINAAARTSKVVPMGWLKAANDIKPYLKAGENNPLLAGTITKGKAKYGRGKPAFPSDAYVVSAEVVNFYSGKNHSDRVTRNKEIGRDAAIRWKAADLDVYIQRKMDEGIIPLNRP